MSEIVRRVAREVFQEDVTDKEKCGCKECLSALQFYDLRAREIIAVMTEPSQQMLMAGHTCGPLPREWDGALRMQWAAMIHEATRP